MNTTDCLVKTSFQCIPKSSLNWLVAKIENVTEVDFFNPCENWSQGGPLVEKHLVSPVVLPGLYTSFHSWAPPPSFPVRIFCDSYLELAMRMIVFKHYGGEVLLPERFLSGSKLGIFNTADEW
jgi:hypothetical protein